MTELKRQEIFQPIEVADSFGFIYRWQEFHGSPARRLREGGKATTSEIGRWP
jgi:hypothetical protein